MGTRKGSIGYSKFYIAGELNKAWRILFPKAMKHAGFRPLDTREDQCSGWVNPLAALDSDITLGKVLHGGQYFCPTLRVDRWNVAKAIIDAHIEQEHERYKREAVVDRVGRRTREAIKDEVTAMLRGKALAQMTLIEAVWNFDQEIVRVWTHSKTALELFTMCFRGAFGVMLAPDSPYTAAVNLDISDEKLMRFESLTPWNALTAWGDGVTSVTLSVDGGPEHDVSAGLEIGKAAPAVTDLMVMIESTRFVGAEFLTWLWFMAEVMHGEMVLASGEELEIYIDDKLTLEATTRNIGSKAALSGGSPAESVEARAALCEGKNVATARFVIRRETREWAFTANGRTMAFSSVRLPGVFASGDDEAFSERMYLIEELDALWSGLYGQFLALRLDPVSWTEEAQLMRKWAHAAPKAEG